MNKIKLWLFDYLLCWYAEKHIDQWDMFVVNEDSRTPVWVQFSRSHPKEAAERIYETTVLNRWFQWFNESKNKYVPPFEQFIHIDELRKKYYG